MAEGAHTTKETVTEGASKVDEAMPDVTMTNDAALFSIGVALRPAMHHVIAGASAGIWRQPWATENLYIPTDDQPSYPDPN